LILIFLPQLRILAVIFASGLVAVKVISIYLLNKKRSVDIIHCLQKTEKTK
jgi:hypothetical protein